MEGLAGYSSDDSDPAPIIQNPIKNEPIKASGGINLSIIPQHIRDALDRSLGDADGADGDSDSDWEHEMQRKSSASRTANGNASTGAAGSAKSLLMSNAIGSKRFPKSKNGGFFKLCSSYCWRCSSQ